MITLAELLEELERIAIREAIEAELIAAGLRPSDDAEAEPDPVPEH